MVGDGVHMYYVANSGGMVPCRVTSGVHAMRQGKVNDLSVSAVV